MAMAKMYATMRMPRPASMPEYAAVRAAGTGIPSDGQLLEL
jgi:hypothetical protein